MQHSREPGECQGCYIFAKQKEGWFVFVFFKKVTACNLFCFSENKKRKYCLVSRQAVKMPLTVDDMFALCWLPLQTYNFLQVIFPSINRFEYINTLCIGFHPLAMSNSCCNPFSYSLFNKKFTTELFERIHSLVRFWTVNPSRNVVVVNNPTNNLSRRNKSGNCKIPVICNLFNLTI